MGKRSSAPTVTGRHAVHLIVLDIDGVLTDGHFLLDEKGREIKKFCFRDLDAVSQAQRQGVRFALLTGEVGALVRQICRRFNISLCVEKAKDKAAALRELSRAQNVPLSRICYVGDGDRDAAALRVSGVGLTPADATPNARRAAQKILRVRGGDGVVSAVLAYLKSRRLMDLRGTD